MVTRTILGKLAGDFSFNHFLHVGNSVFQSKAPESLKASNVQQILDSNFSKHLLCNC